MNSANKNTTYEPLYSYRIFDMAMIVPLTMFGEPPNPATNVPKNVSIQANEKKTKNNLTK